MIPQRIVVLTARGRDEGALSVRSSCVPGGHGDRALSLNGVRRSDLACDSCAADDEPRLLRIEGANL
jgi:hypothetical protein